MKSLKGIRKEVQIMTVKMVDEAICDRIEFLWDTINNSKNISQEEKEAMQEEIYEFRREARKNGESFPDRIEMRF